jgi:hypothetical protein
VDLPAESEEVAGFFGAMLETDHAKDETFCKNFFKDFSDILKRYPVCAISYASLRSLLTTFFSAPHLATRRHKNQGVWSL